MACGKIIFHSTTLISLIKKNEFQGIIIMAIERHDEWCKESSPMTVWQPYL
jgi:hypothetical protein